MSEKRSGGYSLCRDTRSEIRRQTNGSRDFELNVFVIESLSHVQCLAAFRSGIFTEIVQPGRR